MTDWFHKTLKAVSYNRYTVLGIVLGVSALIAFTGCQITTPSPFTDEPVTGEQLEAQVEDYTASVAKAEQDAFAAYQAQVAAIKAEAEKKSRDASRAIDDLNRKRENVAMVAGLFQDVGEIVGGPTGSGIILGTGILMNLLGGGALIDAARRKQLLNSIINPPAPVTPTV